MEQAPRKIPSLGFEDEYYPLSPRKDVMHIPIVRNGFTHDIGVYAWTGPQEGYNVFRTGKDVVSVNTLFEVKMVIQDYINEVEGNAADAAVRMGSNPEG